MVDVPDWQRYGFLTPDALECQQEVWALMAALRARLADVFESLGLQSAEPTWAATLGEAAGHARGQRELLEAEAGQSVRAQVADDELVREALSALDEVVASSHVPSLIATGFATLGELGSLPLRLLDDVAGPHVRVVIGQLRAREDHALLGRLMGIAPPGPRDAEHLRRLLRHLDGTLFAVYESWRQTFHTLGVDGEWLAEEAAATVRGARHTLGLKVTGADLAVFRAG